MTDGCRDKGVDSCEASSAPTLFSHNPQVSVGVKANILSRPRIIVKNEH